MRNLKKFQLIYSAYYHKNQGSEQAISEFFFKIVKYIPVSEYYCTFE